MCAKYYCHAHSGNTKYLSSNKKKLSMVRRPRGHTRTPMCDRYRAKNSISVACRSLPLQCSKKAALACLTGASAPGTPCAMISSLPISTFCAAVSGTRSLTCLNPRLFKGQALYRRPMFVLPSHVSPCTLSIHRPIGDRGQSGKPA